jgi:class 3 adenylate cyclase
MKRIFIQVFLILLFYGSMYPSEADSLLRVLERSDDDSLKVQNLLSLGAIYYRTDPGLAVNYGEQARDLAQTLDYKTGLAYAYKSIGMGYYFQSNYIEALVNWQLALEAFQAINHRQGVSNMLNNLGAVYYNEGDNNKAVEYYVESLRVSEEIGDSLRTVTALVNIGAVYYSKRATHDMALDYYSRALPLSEALGDYDAIGTSAVNMGQIYMDKEDDVSAHFYFNKALDAYRKSETGNVPYAMLNLGRVYAFREDFNTAISLQSNAYELAKDNGARLEMAQALLALAATYDQMRAADLAIVNFKLAKEISEEIGASYVLQDAYDGLAQTYAKVPDYENAFKYQLLYNEIKDTLYNAEMDKRIQALTLNFEIERKQGQIDLLTKDQELMDLTIRRQKLQRNAVAITGFLMLLLAAGIFSRYRYVRKTKKIIEYEKDRSEQLLLNVLPAETAEELKERGSATPKHYDMVTVLFTDFKGFTRIAEKLTPQELVENLDFCFHAFDRIIDKYKIEKIKTIGDAYMCAGGIPVKNTTNPVNVVSAALEIREFMDQLKHQKQADGEDFWELRIGVHTGPVVAGVVGNKKFAYDIWGDAVNTASRMESSGIPGEVNISGETYELIKDQFKCKYRGKIEAKNKGEIAMYIVEGQLETYVEPDTPKKEKSIAFKEKPSIN